MRDCEPAVPWPILTAVRFNPWLRADYEWLVAAGEPREISVIASMRKLPDMSVAKRVDHFVLQSLSSAPDEGGHTHH
jgi:hypothetical protein